jgi:two-component system, NarL family, sensor histidine kinase BarA
VGLGLSISRELCRAMGGDVTLQETSASGSRFRVLLPKSV